jgi:hypothetical protein
MSDATAVDATWTWATVSCIKWKNVFYFNFLSSALFLRIYIFFWNLALEAFSQNVLVNFGIFWKMCLFENFRFSFCREGTSCIAYRQLRLYGIPIVSTHTRTHAHTQSSSFVLHIILKLRNINDWLWYGPMATLLSYFNLCKIRDWIHVSVYRSNSVAQLSHTYRISK